jgi:hypothetical protein
VLVVTTEKVTVPTKPLMAVTVTVAGGIVPPAATVTVDGVEIE